jgi:hypothetical protein
MLAVEHCPTLPLLVPVVTADRRPNIAMPVAGRKLALETYIVALTDRLTKADRPAGQKEALALGRSPPLHNMLPWPLLPLDC